MTTTDNRPITIADAPTECPAWCPPDRHDALYASGCADIEDFLRHERQVAYRHLPALLAFAGYQMRDEGEEYEITIEQPVGKSGAVLDPLIHVRATVDIVEAAELTLTAGEARSMAAQLLHAADLLDLDGVER